MLLLLLIYGIQKSNFIVCIELQNFAAVVVYMFDSSRQLVVRTRESMPSTSSHLIQQDVLSPLFPWCSKAKEQQQKPIIRGYLLINIYPDSVKNRPGTSSHHTISKDY